MLPKVHRIPRICIHAAFVGSLNSRSFGSESTSLAHETVGTSSACCQANSIFAKADDGKILKYNPLSVGHLIWTLLVMHKKAASRIYTTWLINTALWL